MEEMIPSSALLYDSGIILLDALRDHPTTIIADFHIYRDNKFRWESMCWSMHCLRLQRAVRKTAETDYRRRMLTDSYWSGSMGDRGC